MTPRKLLPNAAPKPKPAPPAKRQYSSIVDRRTHSEKIAASQRLRSTTPVKKKNEERIAKKRVSYRQGMARYKKSETYKVVEQRTNGQCEVQMDGTLAPWKILFAEQPILGMTRCPNTRGDGYQLEHHHHGYLRFGGDELPEDMAVVCKPHHRVIENLRGKSEKRFLGGR